MKLDLRHLLILLICAVATSVSAQITCRFYPQQMRHGLSSNRTNSVYCDKQGYVWITTENGLNRFDGQRFRRYYTSFDTKNFLSNYTWGTHEDANGVIWVGMKKDECTLYHPQEDRFDSDVIGYINRLGYKK